VDVAFVADDLAAWLVALLAESGRKRLTTFVLGDDQERALRRAATAAVQRTAEQLCPVDDAQAEQLELVISRVFSEQVSTRRLAIHATVLEELQAGVAERLAALGDGGYAGRRWPSGQRLGVPADLLAQTLSGHLMREILGRGTRGGPLAPLAAQLNHDVTHLQGRRLEGALGQLTVVIQDALAGLNDAHRAALAQLPQAAARPAVQGGEPADPAAGYDGGASRQAVRLLVEAYRVAQSITDGWWRAVALAEIAEVSAASDPGRAARIAAEAEQCAQSIISDGSYLKASALARTAEALIDSDPDRAEQIAQSITDPGHKDQALCELVHVLADSDRDRAEQITQSITVPLWKVLALTCVAKALATSDPDRSAALVEQAEHAARVIAAPGTKALALERVAEALAVFDPERAEQLARSITKKQEKMLALTDVAKTLAKSAPSRAAALIEDAERAARSISKKRRRVSALAVLARLLAISDPGRAAWLSGEAEQVAHSITDEYDKVGALAEVAQLFHASDPGRERILGEAEQVAQSITYGPLKAMALATIAPVFVASDPDRAERIAWSITEHKDKESALEDVAKALAASDPDRAERLAQSITEPPARVRSLTQIARGWLGRQLTSMRPGRCLQETAR
jgi:hypothetical protein